MDTLVARYSRPAFHEPEAFSDPEDQDYNDTVPSLKFAMPPVAQVSFTSALRRQLLVPNGYRFRIER